MNGEKLKPVYVDGIAEKPIEGICIDIYCEGKRTSYSLEKQFSGSVLINFNMGGIAGVQKTERLK